MSTVGVRRKRSARRGGQAAVYAHAVKAVVQLLFATRRSYTIDTLKEKLREFYLEEADYEKRAVASLSTVELMTALLEASPTLSAVGLQLKLANGIVQMATTKADCRKLSEFLLERAQRVTTISEPALEVLSCVALKGPIDQDGIDALFGGRDKRHLVFVLREMEMIEEFVGEKGRLQFSTTGKFLRHFGLKDNLELEQALLELEARQAREERFGFLKPQS